MIPETSNWAGSIHWLPTSKIEAIYRFNYGNGTTVFQGDNRYSLKNLGLQQHTSLTLVQQDKWSIQAYHTSEDAGDSYDGGIYSPPASGCC
ncbi:hypothetical protein [Okeania hirsuta]|uniref:hypothetical protein n=1 Tax=Okeania hirsuta TaxID=1458930 RepID=UPI00129235A4|nr:hypothetical protein [Okeania hirsuta]